MQIIWLRAALAIGVMCNLTFAFSRTTSVTITESSGPYIGAAVGRAFHDVDDDGKFRRGLDRPLAAIAVTDGHTWVETDADGQFKLPLRLASRAVTVTRPPGYWPSTSWCRPIFPPGPDQNYDSAEQFLANASADAMNFAFRKSVVDDPAAFNVMVAFGKSAGTDLQSAKVSPSPDIRLLFQTGPGELTAVPDSVTTLSEMASRTFVFDDITSLTGRFAIDFGSYHFIATRSLADKGFREWLERHPKLDRSTKVVVATEQSAEVEDLEWLSRLNLAAIVEHTPDYSRISRIKGGQASLISQPGYDAGALDGTPASFRILQFSGTQFNTSLRPIGTIEAAAVSAPTAKVVPGGGRLAVNVVSAFDTPESGRFKIRVGPQTVFEGPLKQVAPWTWMAPLAPTALGLQSLPPQFDVQVLLKGSAGAWKSELRGASPLPANPVTAGADWMQFMNSGQHSGFSREAGPLPPLDLAWVTPTHGSVLAGGPVVYRGALAVGVRDTDNMIANGVALLDAASGRMKKFVKTDEAVAHAAAFVEDTSDGPGIIYAQSTAGTVYRIAPTDGGLLDKSGGLRRDVIPILSGPVAQGKLAVTGGASFAEGYSAQYAERRWTSREVASAITYSPASLAGPEIIVTNGQKDGPSILGLNANSGRANWKINVGGVPGSVLTVPGIGYAVTRNGALIKIDLQSATVASSLTLAAAGSAATPAFSGQRLIVPVEGLLACVNRETMEVVWRFHPEKSLWRVSYTGSDSAVFSSPAIAGNRIFVGCSDGRLYCLDAETGKAQWYHDFGIPVLAAPSVSGNAVFVAPADGNVYAFTGATQ